jgi:hypothetical protein
MPHKKNKQPMKPDPERVRECRCGRDGVEDRGQCAVRDGWGALRPGTYCRRGNQPSPTPRFHQDPVSAGSCRLWVSPVPGLRAIGALVCSVSASELLPRQRTTGSSESRLAA